MKQVPVSSGNKNNKMHSLLLHIDLFLYAVKCAIANPVIDYRVPVVIIS